MDKQLLNFILINIFIVGILLLAAYKVRKRKMKKEGKDVSFGHFINGSSINMKSTLIGLVFGIVFGFIDNFGLWFGIESLSKYMPGGVKMKAALGNTYSDGVGAIVGTFLAIIIKDLFNFDGDEDNKAIWINPVGIVIGCLLGIVVGKAFLK